MLLGPAGILMIGLGLFQGPSSPPSTQSEARARDGRLHPPQSDGSVHYAHALDLHARRHPILRNRPVQLYFEVLGFRTRRHGRMADHLHVALPLPGA